MQTIAIVNEKGGTAKTTTAVNLSAALGAAGQKVLLVDLDGQAASSRWLGVEEDNRLADALIRGKGLEPIENVAPGVSLAPATGKLDSVAHELRPSQGGQLRKVLRRVESRYDLILMDCPPSLGNRLIGNALLAATHAIVPVETSILALDGLKILLTTLEDIREGFGHGIVMGGVLACRYDGRTRLSRLVLEELRRALPGKVFQTVIRENVRMRECPASGESILTFAPDSHAAEDYQALAKEMLSRPEMWQEPAPWDLTYREGPLPESEQCSVASLRSNAAASVRAAAKASWRKGDASQADESPDEDLLGAIPDADQIAPRTPEPVPGPDKAAAEVNVPPPPPASAPPSDVQPWAQSLPAAIIGEATRTPGIGIQAPRPHFGNTRRVSLDACLERLAEAEERLSAEEEAEAKSVSANSAPLRPFGGGATVIKDDPAPSPPTLERPPAVEQTPPAAEQTPPAVEQTPPAAEQPRPSAEQPPAEVREPEPEPETLAEQQTPQDEQAEGGDKFPALREYLRQMGQAGKGTKLEKASASAGK